MSECNRCGNCCTSAYIGLYSIRKGQDQQQYAEWLAHHHLEPKWWIPREGEEPVLRVKIPLICKHLSFNGKTGLAFCKIYEDRPQICRDHLCERLRDNA